MGLPTVGSSMFCVVALGRSAGILVLPSLVFRKVTVRLQPPYSNRRLSVKYFYKRPGEAVGRFRWPPAWNCWFPVLICLGSLAGLVGAHFNIALAILKCAGLIKKWHGHFFSFCYLDWLLVLLCPYGSPAGSPSI